MDDLDVLHRQAQLVGGDLRERRLVALTVRVRTGEDRHLSGRVHAHGGALVESRLRAERARHLGGSEPASLDVGGEADAEVAALLPQLVLLAPEGALALVEVRPERAGRQRHRPLQRGGRGAQIAVLQQPAPQRVMLPRRLRRQLRTPPRRRPRLLLLAQRPR